MDFIRLMLVLACMAPLFILMAIRGVGIVPWEIYFPSFIGLALIPNLILVFRIFVAIKNNDRKRIRVTNSTDNREQLITYIFAMLLPLFQSSVSTEQDLCGFVCIAFCDLHFWAYGAVLHEFLLCSGRIPHSFHPT